MKFSKIINDKKRETGFYWVRIKRTQLWVIAYYFPSLGSFEITSMMRFDNRSGYDLVCEEKLQAPVYVEPLVVRRTKKKVQKIKVARRR